VFCIISKVSHSGSTRSPLALAVTHGLTTRRPASPSSSTARHSGRGGYGVSERHIDGAVQLTFPPPCPGVASSCRRGLSGLDRGER
jgi:hypothetical protein